MSLIMTNWILLYIFLLKVKMKLTKKATSIIEAMIVLMIILVWVIWLYDIFISSQKFSDSTKHRIEAIEIAREWVEAIKNIRDTNWLLFWADSDNCWNVLNYQTTCIGTTGALTDIWDWNYTIVKAINNRWELNVKNNAGVYWDTSYMNDFLIYKDANWFYTHDIIGSTKTVFTRKITISYNWGTMQINSLVNWVDSSTSSAYKVDIDLELTNWKK